MVEVPAKEVPKVAPLPDNCKLMHPEEDISMVGDKGGSSLCSSETSQHSFILLACPVTVSMHKLIKKYGSICSPALLYLPCFHRQQHKTHHNF